MDFEWSAEQRALHESARRFAESLGPAPAAGFRRDAWKRLGEFGALGLSLPQHLGGSELDCLNTALVIEGLGRGSSDRGLLFAGCAHLFAACMPIAEHASPELARRIVPGLAGGQLIGANAITESEAGSDVFALKTRAERRPEGYLLNGTKSFVTNGPEADVFLVYASTEPQHGHLGVSAFVVERGAPGLRLGEKFETHGLRGASIGAVYFEDCLVSEANRVGAEGAGAAVFHSSMRWERCCLFALYVGAMERQLAAVVEHAKERRQFGKPIGKQQAVSHRIVDMLLRLEASRLLLYRACWSFNQGDEAQRAVPLAKLAVSEAAVQSGLDAIQLHGGSGVMSETLIDELLLDALPATIFSGTSEVQRNLLARGLGL